MTLPPNLVLGEVEKNQILEHIQATEPMLEMTPANAADYEAAMLVAITKMVKVLPAQRADEIGYEARGEAYLAAVEDIPIWAVEEGIRGWYRGEHGNGFDYKWAPQPFELRTVAERKVLMFKAHIRKLRNVANAVALIEYGADYRANMAGRVDQVLKKFKAIS